MNELDEGKEVEQPVQPQPPAGPSGAANPQPAAPGDLTPFRRDVYAKVGLSHRTGRATTWDWVYRGAPGGPALGQII